MSLTTMISVVMVPVFMVRTNHIVDEDEHFNWYTVNDEYVYINGYKHKYSCNGTSLSLEVKPGRMKYYYSK